MTGSYIDGGVPLFPYGFDGVIDGSDDDGLLLFAGYEDLYEVAIRPPGDWTITIKGTALDGTEITKDFTWTLLDPCSPPASV